MLKKQNIVDDIYNSLDKNHISMSEIDKNKFFSIVNGIFEIDEKSLNPIRESATLYGKISLKIYFFGVLGCAALSIIFSLISLWFKSIQEISFLFLGLFYICFLLYNHYNSLSYKSEIDFSIFSVDPYSYKLKSLSDIYLPKLMELSEKSIETGFLVLKDSCSDLSSIVSGFINPFISIISFPGIFAFYFIFFKMNLKPWILVISYGNMIMLLLITIRYVRSNLLVIYDYAFAIIKVALKLKSGKNM